MRFIIQIFLAISLAGILPATTLHAQSDEGNFITTLNEIEESYVQIVAGPNQEDANDDVASAIPALANVVFVADTEEEASEAFREILAAAGSNTSAPSDKIDDLGDIAVLIYPSEDDDVTQVVVAREENVIMLVSAANWPDDSTIPVEVARHIFDQGPADEPYAVSDDGLVSGGWTRAFPQSGDFEELDTFEFLPITQWHDVPEPVMAATVSSATPVAQPQLKPISMLTQNYIDVSDEGVESDSLPQIVLITVQEFDSPKSAEIAFESISAGGPDQTGMTTEPIESLGDEAVFVDQTDEGGDHGATTIARDENVVVMAFVTGAPAQPDISKDIVTHIIETGSSEEPISFDAEGVATGGWADAFPQPDEIPGLEHFSPQPVTKFNDD